MPRIPLSGVRTSWLTVARNRLWGSVISSPIIDTTQEEAQVDVSAIIQVCFSKTNLPLTLLPWDIAGRFILRRRVINRTRYPKARNMSGRYVVRRASFSRRIDPRLSIPPLNPQPGWQPVELSILARLRIRNTQPLQTSITPPHFI